MDEIYRKHAGTVYRYLLSLTQKEDLSEELTQETFYQAVKSIGRFDGSCAISTWLCAIARHVLSSYRRKHPEMTELDETAFVTDSVEAQTLSKAGQLDVMRALHRLEGEQREVLYLRLLGSLSFREIGEILNRTENWARVTYYRGREKMKKELSSNGDKLTL